MFAKRDSRGCGPFSRYSHRTSWRKMLLVSPAGGQETCPLKVTLGRSAGPAHPPVHLSWKLGVGDAYRGDPPPKLPGTVAGGTRRSHGTRGRGVPGGAQAYPRCLSFPLSRQRLLQRLGPVWALQRFEALPRTQFSLTLCNTVSWAGVVLPTLQKRKWRPPKGDAQPHRISDWYSEVPRPVDLCWPHPAAGQPGNFLNSTTVSGLRVRAPCL